ncbi:Pimeloyl-ACP methyl ester carboxylesterase [Sulfitobacter brevis]|uniref:Pimeloyl-ACP methyl ester carboxylesterase n=1 Tax=Sulfitobacter brevis TaxID=74348 RepID=A0A1I1T6I8_9RHOB|nr:alpha/beta hydrolase [Sulfitobacter brevis]SFD54239.1 Pimeloyl-ACP methyl ester carboxylesterase [Sulfitobacter brevis]
MTEPRFRLVPVMDHEIVLTEWGDPALPTLVMAHGLARTGRDFDEIASALSDSYHVLCPDLIGRGLSSWSDNPQAEYSIEYYAGIYGDLLDHCGVDRTAWLGTSLGGLIGMHLASGREADRITALVINDIGPELPDLAVERILTYIGALPEFADLAQAESWLREVYLPFGPASDDFWWRMARTSVRRRANGRLALHYDPRIAVQFSASRGELTSWDRWDRIVVPTHVLRGANSDLLSAAVAERMGQAGPEPQTTVIDDCGHAPTLSRPGDSAMVREILGGLSG